MFFQYISGDWNHWLPCSALWLPQESYDSHCSKLDCTRWGACRGQTHCPCRLVIFIFNSWLYKSTTVFYGLQSDSLKSGIKCSKLKANFLHGFTAKFWPFITSFLQSKRVQSTENCWIVFYMTLKICLWIIDWKNSLQNQVHRAIFSA